MWFPTYYARPYEEDLERRRSISRHARRFRMQMRETREAERQEAIDASLGELALFCHASVDLMIEKGLLTREELVERMREIDASDGEVDGRFDPPGEEA